MNAIKNVKIIGGLVLLLFLGISFIIILVSKKGNDILILDISNERSYTPSLEEMAVKEDKNSTAFIPKRKYVPTLEEIFEKGD